MSVVKISGGRDKRAVQRAQRKEKRVYGLKEGINNYVFNKALTAL